MYCLFVVLNKLTPSPRIEDALDRKPVKKIVRFLKTSEQRCIGHAVELHFIGAFDHYLSPSLLKPSTSVSDSIELG